MAGIPPGLLWGPCPEPFSSIFRTTTLQRLTLLPTDCPALAEDVPNLGIHASVMFWVAQGLPRIISSRPWLLFLFLQHGST